MSNTNYSTQTGPLVRIAKALEKIASASGDTYAPLDSPAFTGTPTAPTAAAGTDTEQLATCAFVTDAINTAIVEVENGTY